MEQAIAALRFDPLVPPWLLGVLGALCLAALVLPVWRRTGSMLRRNRMARYWCCALPAVGCWTPLGSGRPSLVQSTRTREN